MREQRAKRNSAIELLRIVAMLMIISVHLRGLVFHETDALFYRICNVLFCSWGYYGVALFFIMSAWFMVDQQFRAKRIFALLVQFASYVVLFTIVRFIRDALSGGVLFALKNAVIQEFYSALQPVHANDYWFISSYFAMCFASPFLNSLFSRYSMKSIKKILVIFAFIPIFANVQFNGGFIFKTSCCLYLYLLVGYVKKEVYNKQNKMKYLWISVELTAVVIISEMVTVLFGKNGIWGFIFDFLNITFGNILTYSTIMTVIALTMFLYVVSLEPKQSRVIDFLAQKCLGVYLFHEGICGDNLVIDEMYAVMEQAGMYTIDWLFPIRYLLSVILVFAISAFVELIRIITVQVPIVRIMESKMSVLMNALDQYFQFVQDT